MSIQGMVWALEDAPDVPPNLVGVLLGLANHADADGKGAYPPVDRLAYYGRKAHRQVQNDLKKLRELNLISLGDQRLVAHIDPRYRPVVYDLAMHRRRPRYVKMTTAPEQSPARDQPITQSSDAPDCTPDPLIDDTQGCTPAHPGVHSTAPKPSLEPSLEKPPYPPPVDSANSAHGGGETLTADDQLTAAVDETLRHQPRWRRASVLAALRQAIADGLDATVACKVMPELAEGSKYGPTTAGPQRILARGPWWTPGEVFVPRPRQILTPCPKHPGEPADNCGCCIGEKRGADHTPSSVTFARTGPSADARRFLAEIGLRSNRRNLAEAGSPV